jgi:hypothetical protein
LILSVNRQHAKNDHKPHHDRCHRNIRLLKAKNDLLLSIRARRNGRLRVNFDATGVKFALRSGEE